MSVLALNEKNPATDSSDVGKCQFPNDWEIAPLGNFYDFQNGVNADAALYGSGVPFANVLEIITCSHLVVKHIPGRIRLHRDAIRGFGLRRGDVLFNRTSETQGEVGLAAVYLDDSEAVFGGFVLRGRPRNDAFDPLYAGYAFRSAFVRSQIVSKGQGAVRANIGQSDLRTVLVPRPSATEQTAIAEVLWDTDVLIESIERLVAKKRAIKQGAMQELLREKPEDEIRPLKEISYMKGRIGWQGLKQSEFTNNADDPFLITGMNFKDGEIRWDEVYHIPIGRYEIAPDIHLKSEDLLMTKDGTIGKVLYVDEIPYPYQASLNSHLLLLRPIKESYYPKYLYYQFGSKRFKDFIEISKSGTTFFGLSQSAAGEYQVLLPPLEEQKRIADRLSDMDHEILILERKLLKTRQIKQGLMQELLNGNVRLI
ncbi:MULTISPECIES: restriction endonuclease subunit S [unclassified Sphingobium]|uniref:restriction endonuclease subunit S n=1 Tax=unclassified Sphingobium TaxID=2611147 RepID=UPI000B26C038|nr:MULTISPECIES: restriction endonuclease subunit S [unclassified Sphingobium]